MSAREDDILSVRMVDEEKDGQRGEEAYDDAACRRRGIVFALVRGSRATAHVLHCRHELVGCVGRLCDGKTRRALALVSIHTEHGRT
jgi:hypothetical protein